MAECEPTRVLCIMLRFFINIHSIWTELDLVAETLSAQSPVLIRALIDKK